MKRSLVGCAFFMVAGFALALILGSCATTTYNPKMYADVVGFNDNVVRNYQLYDLQPQSGQTEKMTAAIRALPSGENTAAYYALDLALDRIVEVKNKYMEGDPASRYYIIFFTDGLDNVSTELARRNGRGDYNSAEGYSAALQNRMLRILGKNNTTNTFQSYVLLYRGDDITRSGYTEEELEARLSPFTGAQNEQRPRVIQGSDLAQLLEDFKKAFVVTSFSFIIPKGYSGSRIQMQLNESENEDEKIFFEADFRRQTSGFLFFKKELYTLENIKISNGFSLQIPVNGIIEMERDRYDRNSNTVPFTVTGLKLGDMPYSVNREAVSQWFYDGGRLRLNSEYRSSSESTKNAYILLVMDTSTSFKTQIDEAKNTANAIVLYISEQL